MSRQDDIEKLIFNYSRRLQKLKEQLALHGSSTDPKILIEIEDTETAIDNLQIKLENIKDTAQSPTVRTTTISSDSYGESQRAKQRNQLEERVRNQRDILHELKLQKIKFGVYVPPHIVIDIKEGEAELKRLEQELENLQ